MKQCVILALLLSLSVNIQAQNIGSRFPLDKIKEHLGFVNKTKVQEPLLLVFIDQFNPNIPYINMMGHAFENYFANGYAIAGKSLKVIIIQKKEMLLDSIPFKGLK